MDWRCDNRFDVSPYLLLEATGDSEEDAGLAIVGDESVVDNDDAESCSYESCDVIFIDDYNEDYHECYNEDQNISDYYTDGHHDENQKNPRKVCLSDFSSGSVCLVGRDDDDEENSRVCHKGRRDDQEMNEVEKNKLFWDTCLEVGCL